MYGVYTQLCSTGDTGAGSLFRSWMTVCRALGLASWLVYMWCNFVVQVHWVLLACKYRACWQHHPPVYMPKCQAASAFGCYRASATKGICYDKCSNTSWDNIGKHDSMMAQRAGVWLWVKLYCIPVRGWYSCHRSAVTAAAVLFLIARQLMLAGSVESLRWQLTSQFPGRQCP